MRRRGFTAIELLVAISIIVLLVGIVVFALSAITSQAKDKSTRLTLTNLRGMMAELDTKGGLSRQPPTMWYNNAQVGAGDFWHDANPTDNVPPLTPPNLPEPDPIPYTIPAGVPPTLPVLHAGTPASVKRGEDDRYLSDAVANTTIAFRIMVALPANRTAMAGLPSNQVEKPPTTEMLPTAGKKILASDPPLVLDGWGNPVIFVPSGGLTVTFPSRKNAVGLAPASVVTSAGVIPFGQSPSQSARPFFASAGPDGDFSKGDDNIYSFEQ